MYLHLYDWISRRQEQRMKERENQRKHRNTLPRTDGRKTDHIERVHQVFNKMKSIYTHIVLVGVLQRNRTRMCIYRKSSISRHCLAQLQRLTSPKICKVVQQAGDPRRPDVVVQVQRLSGAEFPLALGRSVFYSIQTFN